VLRWGTGGLNVAACRVEGVPRTTHARGNVTGSQSNKIAYQPLGEGHESDGPAGRWPPNAIFTHAATCTTTCAPGCPVAEMDRQSGTLTSPGPYVQASKVVGIYGPEKEHDRPSTHHGDSGGASRFFPIFKYCAKAPTSERPRVAKDGAGEGRVTGLDGKIRRCRVCGSQNAPLDQRCGHDDYEWVPAPTRQDHVSHPTVKPLDLMRWLVKLVCPPGGTVLDPFAGSGTTGEAAILEGVRCILIEREADYLPLIVARLTRRTDPAAYAAHTRGDDEPDDLLSLLDLA
jgi:hypothetical protein